jgi:hypothetical protein
VGNPEGRLTILSNELVSLTYFLLAIGAPGIRATAVDTIHFAIELTLIRPRLEFGVRILSRSISAELPCSLRVHRSCNNFIGQLGLWGRREFPNEETPTDDSPDRLCTRDRRRYGGHEGRLQELTTSVVCSDAHCAQLSPHAFVR